MLGGQPGPAGQLRRPGRTGDVTDLGDEHRGQDRADPGDLLDRGVAGVVRPAGPGPAWRTGRSRSPGRRSAGAARRPAPRTVPGSVEPVQQLGCPPRPNRSVIGTWTPHLASTAWTSALQPRAQPDQLGPVPHQLAQLPGRRRRDPRLAAADPSAADRPDRRRRAESFFTRRYSNALTPNGCARCTDAPDALQRVGRPVPAVGRLQHHLRDLPGPGHHRVQPVHVVDDPDRLQLLASLASSARSPTGADADRSRRTAALRTLRSQGPPSS